MSAESLTFRLHATLQLLKAGAQQGMHDEARPVASTTHRVVRASRHHCEGPSGPSQVPQEFEKLDPIIRIRRNLRFQAGRGFHSQISNLRSSPSVPLAGCDFHDRYTAASRMES